MAYLEVLGLFQKLHQLIHAKQFMTSKIVIPLSFVFLHLESVKRKGKNYKNLENEELF